VKVAAYQAPYLPFGSLDAVELICEQLATCAARGVEILCCPEAVIGGLAHESAGQSPADVAFEVGDGALTAVVAPLLGSPVTAIVGFTERDAAGNLFNAAAVLEGGRIAAVHRKSFPGYRTVIQAGGELRVLRRSTTWFFLRRSERQRAATKAASRSA